LKSGSLWKTSLEEVTGMSENNSQQSALNNETATAPKDFRIPAALVRTALSSEQTLMSWIRTSLSLLTLGFSIVQFFHYLGQRQGGDGISAGPRRMGISLICVGVIVLLLAMVEHLLRLRKMKKEGLPADSVSFLPIGSAVALLLIGLAAFISTIMNWSL
jgi:putative membrane protein